MEAAFETPLPLILGILAGIIAGVAWTVYFEVVGRDQGQAAMVAGRIRATGAGKTGAALNGSELPVFSVVAWVVATAGTAPGSGEEWVARLRRDEASPDGRLDSPEPSTPAMLALLPPGRADLELPAWARSGDGERPAIELAFTDASGRHWVRRAGGRLQRLDRPAWRHYGFTSPGAV